MRRESSLKSSSRPVRQRGARWRIVPEMVYLRVNGRAGRDQARLNVAARSIAPARPGRRLGEVTADGRGAPWAQSLTSAHHG